MARVLITLVQPGDEGGCGGGGLAVDSDQVNPEVFGQVRAETTLWMTATVHPLAGVLLSGQYVLPQVLLADRFEVDYTL